MCTHTPCLFSYWGRGGGISGSSRLCKVLSQAVAGLPNLEEQSSSSHKVQFIHFLLWLMLVLYLRNLFLTPGYKDPLLCSLLEILVLDHTHRSMILSLCQYTVRGLDPSSTFVSSNTHCPHTTCWKDYLFSVELRLHFVENCLHLCGPVCRPSILFHSCACPLPTPTPHCPNCSHFVVNLEIRLGMPSAFILCYRICANCVHFMFPCELENQLLQKTLIRFRLGLLWRITSIRETWCFNHTASSHLWTQSISPFIKFISISSSTIL